MTDTTSTTGEDSPDTGTRSLKKVITGPLLFAFIVGDTLGAGIYTLVGTMAADVGGVIWLPLLIALVIALLTAGTYAELITKYPHAGGAARYVDRAFGTPYLSFLVGFLMMASGITTAASLANAFAGDYLGALLEVPPAPTAIVFIAILTLVNLRGVKESLTANLVASVIEVSGLVIVIVCAAVFFGGGNGDASRVLEFNPDVAPLQGAFAASIVAFFSFLGFEAAANMAEEVRNPSKVYPRALFGALITAAVVYLLIALGAVIVLPNEELASSSGPLLDVVAASGVAVPPWLFGLIALVAIANGALLFMVMASRVGFGLATSGLLPSAFGRVLPGRRTPWVSIVVVGGVTMLLTLIGDVGTLAETTVLLLLLVFIAANVSVLVLKKDRVDHPHFSVPRAVPVLATIASVVLLTQQTGVVWLATAGYVVVGTLLFLATRFGKKAHADRSASDRG
ncbi:APC family permease [Rathayibacter tanaceti]|uniref:Amino acid permease n=2 Tax=Rathayibacter tanaceti TaxID=1671680 RepID=A0A162F7M0_9MICO|nr:APC family permease [Rathayibacter tanaceti]KZX20143.1 putative amino acid permease YhdG [Rathayibacter tanaceti]QHC55124.1 amino acid permease [Rathayibacter tanaceti]TCO34738.1 amino acid transporter [Rathayibacter tanaceti]